MLIRFSIKNLFLFKEETEFNLLPGKVKRLNHHKYLCGGIEVLKLTGLYGANGSGKSNLIRSISLLKSMLISGEIPPPFFNQKFKLSKTSLNEPVELAIEFFANNLIYYYSVVIDDEIIKDEYFGFNGKGQEDELIFHRRFENNKATIYFFNGFDEKSENKILKNVIENDLLKPHQPLFTLLNAISNPAFSHIKVAYEWFMQRLIVIFPYTKPFNLPDRIDKKDGFGEFSNKLMASLNTGISGIKVEKTSIEEFLGRDNISEIEKVKSNFKRNSEISFVRHVTNENEEIVFVNEKEEIVAKRLFLEHTGENDERIQFKVHEESDGTRRLLEYLPAWEGLLNSDTTYIIDEIERSIHPLVIKELIEKFSKSSSNRGQLIFSTHETNLLDQEILRADEIWFAEKNSLGCSKLYSLSEFKEHNTIDIRKGYLNGRYGAIPFLGTLKELNWV